MIFLLMIETATEQIIFTDHVTNSKIVTTKATMWAVSYVFQFATMSA
jgi:hypothetical protein